MIFMFITDKNGKKEEMLQHKSTLVAAIALMCKKEPERVQRSVILSTALGFWIPVAKFPSVVSLATFSLTTGFTSEVKMESFSCRWYPQTLILP